MKKTKKIASKTTYYGYSIDHHAYGETTREADPNEEFDGDDTHTDWDISSFITPSQNPDFVAPFEVVEGKTYYAVYVIYSTGDSFSRQENGRISFVELYESKDKAEKLVNTIQKGHNQENSSLSMEYLDEYGFKKTEACQWNGYFESISICEAKEVSLPKLQKKLTK